MSQADNVEELSIATKEIFLLNTITSNAGPAYIQQPLIPLLKQLFYRRLLEIEVKKDWILSCHICGWSK